MKKVLIAVAFLAPLGVVAAPQSSTTEQKANAAGNCLSYLTMFDRASFKENESHMKTLYSVYSNSIKNLLQAESGREIKKSNVFSEVGIDLDDDFYMGYILSSTIKENTDSIKDSINPAYSATLNYAELKEQWSREARKRFSDSNCALIN